MTCFCGSFEQRDAQADFASRATGNEWVGDDFHHFGRHPAPVIFDAGCEQVGVLVFANADLHRLRAGADAVFSQIEQVQGDFFHRDSPLSLGEGQCEGLNFRAVS